MGDVTVSRLVLFARFEPLHDAPVHPDGCRHQAGTHFDQCTDKKGIAFRVQDFRRFEGVGKEFADNLVVHR
ncbi:hypothetical protein Barb4_02357 [Bacteroidales bacterium Barb4]|nr:hypothetical protein Barb4_02357 [Bacteroidales bacterium Barb4]